MKEKTTELDSSGIGQGPVVGFIENGIKPSGYIKVEEFIDKLIVLTVSQVGLCSMKLVTKEKLHRIQCTVCYKNRYTHRHMNSKNG
jgi:hypothetical protein